MSPTIPMEEPIYPHLIGWFFKGIDLLVTLLLWAYFTLVFAFIFVPLYLSALLFASHRRTAFQRLTHYFIRGFFFLCRLLAPAHRWCIDPAIRNIRSSVVVCNHISFLDSIMMVSLFKRHTTIVKDRIFKIPVMRQLLVLSGYLPSTGGGRLAELMVRRMETLEHDLSEGANLFIFPEGTRSRTGSIGEFNPGAFKLARLCRAPIQVLRIRNTDRLFKPGTFLFQTCLANTISLDLVASLKPPYDSKEFSLAALMAQAREAMEQPKEDEAV